MYVTITIFVLKQSIVHLRPDLELATFFGWFKNNCNNMRAGLLSVALY